MTAQAKIEKPNFAAGEVGRSVRAHTDLDRYNAGVEICENMVVLAEGILTRRPGTRLVREVKNEAELGRLIPFRFSGADSAMIVLNGGVARFIKNGAFLGAPYELSVPYTEGLLEALRAVNVGNIVYLAHGAVAPKQLVRAGDTNWSLADYAAADGPFEPQNLDKAKFISANGVSGAVALAATGIGFSPAHVGSLWRLDESTLGLVAEWLPNETLAQPIEPIPAGVIIGDMLNAANAFDANAGTFATKLAALSAYVGMSSASRIYQATITAEAAAGFASGSDPAVQVTLYGKVGAAPANADDGIALATQVVVDAPGLAVTLTSSDTATVFNHRWFKLLMGSGPNINVAEVAFTRFVTGGMIRRRWNGNVYDAVSFGNSGVAPPTHTEGDALSGVTWRFRHGPYGVVKIAAVFDPDHASANVLTTLPDSVTAQPTYRWWPPAWSADLGWPDNVQTFDNRLNWFRKHRFWDTQPNSPTSFKLTADELSALAETLTQESGALPEIAWALASGILVLGARDGEWLVRGPSAFDALTPGNIRVVSDSTEGSAVHVPARVDGGALFIGRSRDRLHYLKFDRLSEQLNPQEISIGARHIIERKLYRLAWERDPNRVAWMRAGLNGFERLAGCTFMPEQKIIGWHRHPLERDANGLPADSERNAVEDMASIPTSDDGRSDSYFIVRRFIGGVWRRFVEQLQPYFAPLDPDNPTAEGAWFVDCGLRFTGVNLASVTAAHLKGATVRVFADGADQGLRSCDPASGAVLVDPPANDVLVGLPIVARVRDLPRNKQTQEGSSKTSIKRTSHADLEVLFSAGGKLRMFDAKRPDGGLFTALTPTGGHPAGAPIPLVTDTLEVTLSASNDKKARLELVLDNALPFTLAGLTATMHSGD